MKFETESAPFRGATEHVRIGGRKSGGGAGPCRRALAAVAIVLMAAFLLRPGAPAAHPRSLDIQDGSAGQLDAADFLRFAFGDHAVVEAGARGVEAREARDDRPAAKPCSRGALAAIYAATTPISAHDLETMGVVFRSLATGPPAARV